MEAGSGWDGPSQADLSAFGCAVPWAFLPIGFEAYPASVMSSASDAASADTVVRAGPGW